MHIKKFLTIALSMLTAAVAVSRHSDTPRLLPQHGVAQQQDNADCARAHQSCRIPEKAGIRSLFAGNRFRRWIYVQPKGNLVALRRPDASDKDVQPSHRNLRLQPPHRPRRTPGAGERTICPHTSGFDSKRGDDVRHPQPLCRSRYAHPTYIYGRKNPRAQQNG